MIVCLCRRISDRDIAQAVREGTHSFELLRDETGVASQCGCCHDSAREVFDAALAAQGCGAGCACAGARARSGAAA